MGATNQVLIFLTSTTRDFRMLGAGQKYLKKYQLQKFEYLNGMGVEEQVVRKNRSQWTCDEK
jgi:hypothetical protein